MHAWGKFYKVRNSLTNRLQNQQQNMYLRNTPSDTMLGMHIQTDITYCLMSFLNFYS